MRGGKLLLVRILEIFFPCLSPQLQYAFAESVEVQPGRMSLEEAKNILGINADFFCSLFDSPSVWLIHPLTQVFKLRIHPVK